MRVEHEPLRTGRKITSAAMPCVWSAAAASRAISVVPSSLWSITWIARRSFCQSSPPNDDRMRSISLPSL
jgi:hypothetical protein